MSAQNAVRSDDETLPFNVKFFYGGFEGGLSIMWGVFWFYFLFFLTDIVGMNPGTAGVILLIAGVWDAITDPVAGVISDRTKSKWGRRRPYIITFLVPFALSAWLLFTDFGLSPGWTAVYFIGVNLCYFFLSDFIAVPANALVAEMTRDYNERTTVVSWKTFWSSVTSFIGIVAPLLLVEGFTELLGDVGWAWSAMMATLAIVGMIPIFLAWHFTRGYERNSEALITITMRELQEMLLNNRAFLNLVGFVITGLGATGVIVTSFIYFLEHVMGYAEDQSASIMLLFAVVSVLAIWPVQRLMQRYGKRTATIIGGVLAVVIHCVFWFASPSQETLFIVTVAFAGSVNTVMLMLYWAIIPDVTEVDEFKSGQRREGVYFAAADFLFKIVSAIGAFMVGQLLELTAYTPEAPSAASIIVIRLSISLIPALLTLGVIWFGLTNPMTKARHQALREAIALKKAGKPYETTRFQELL